MPVLSQSDLKVGRVATEQDSDNWGRKGLRVCKFFSSQRFRTFFIIPMPRIFLVVTATFPQDAKAFWDQGSVWLNLAPVFAKGSLWIDMCICAWILSHSSRKEDRVPASDAKGCSLPRNDSFHRLVLMWNCLSHKHWNLLPSWRCFLLSHCSLMSLYWHLPAAEDSGRKRGRKNVLVHIDSCNRSPVRLWITRMLLSELTIKVSLSLPLLSHDTRIQASLQLPGWWCLCHQQRSLDPSKRLLQPVLGMGCWGWRHVSQVCSFLLLLVLPATLYHLLAVKMSASCFLFVFPLTTPTEYRILSLPRLFPHLMR